jgi:hypothetical protein
LPLRRLDERELHDSTALQNGYLRRIGRGLTLPLGWHIFTGFRAPYPLSSLTEASMKRIGLGAVVVLVAVVSVWLSRTALWGQAPSQGPFPTPVHTIKITLYEENGDKSRCRLAIAPEIGVYPEDSVVWNVENGCDTTATIRIGDPTVVGGKEPLLTEPLPEKGMVVVPRKGRRHIVARVRKDFPFADSSAQYEFPVTQEAPPPPAPPPPAPPPPPDAPTIKGTAYFCREPPCGRKY